MPQSAAFADRLRSLREAAGLSQYALAKRSGLSKQAVSSLELGNREPAWVTVQLLAAALEVVCREFVDPTLRLPDYEPARPKGRPRESAGPEKEPKRRRGKK
jgi:transcriptional regulator with XRE-family HTH domain